MDKFEYKVRSEEIKNLIAEGDYAQAAEIADAIDWRRVKSVMTLCTISDLYKINRRYEDAKNVLMLAYERRPGGRTICYSLCELCIKTGDFVQALNYYKEFVNAAPRDSSRYILKYKLYEAQDVSLEERIAVLEELKKRDYREKWAYELAFLYHRVGLATRCVEECDELALWFGDGKYVVKALELKMLHQPLTPGQQEVYDHRFDGYSREDIEPGEAGGQSGDYESEAVYDEPGDYGQEPDYTQSYDQEENSYNYEEQEAGEESMAGESSADDQIYAWEQAASVEDGYEPGSPDDMDIQVKTMDVGKYNTINLQAELAAGLQEVLGGDQITHSIMTPMLEGGEEEILSQEQSAEEEALPEEEIEGTEVFFGETGEMTRIQPEAGQLQEVTMTPDSGEMEEVAPEKDVVRGEAAVSGKGVVRGEAVVSGEGAARREGVVRGEAVVSGEGAARGETAVSGEGVVRGEAVVSGGGAARREAAVSGEGAASREAVAQGPDVSADETAGAAMREMSAEASAAKEAQILNVQPPKELADVLSQEANGQISLVLPESALVEKQLTGQMKIEDVLAEWERMKKENQEKCQEAVRQRVLRQTGPMFSEFEASVRDGLLEKLEKGIVPEGAPLFGISVGGANVAETAWESEYFEDAKNREDPGAVENIDDRGEETWETSDNPEEMTEEGYPEEAAQYEEEEYPEETAESEGEEYRKETAETGEEEYLEEYAGETAELVEEEYPEETAEAEEREYLEEYAEEIAEAVEEEYPKETAEAEEREYLEEYAEEIAEAVEEEYSEDASEAGEGEYPEELVEQEELPEAVHDNQRDGRVEGAHNADTARDKAQTAIPRKRARTSGDNIEPFVERDKAKIRGLTREEKELYAPFIQSRHSREQIVKAIDNISMAAYTGNVIITGEEGMDTMSLAKNMIREVRMMDSNFSGRVAKISGDGLNQRNMEDTLEHLNNGALIVQAASGMSAETARALHKSLQQERLGIVIFLEDTKKGIKNLFSQVPELAGGFTARMDLEALSNDMLVSFGRRYAREMEYSIDDLGVLALHTRIEELQTIDHAVTVIEVKQIVDEAIHHASRKTLGHFFDILLAKRYDDEDMIVLTERDFVA